MDLNIEFRVANAIRTVPGYEYVTPATQKNFPESRATPPPYPCSRELSRDHDQICGTPPIIGPIVYG